MVVSSVADLAPIYIHTDEDFSGQVRAGVE